MLDNLFIIMVSIELSSSLFYPMYLELYQGIMYIFGCFRLTDCIELLQSMERKGLLDMDKVDLCPSYLSSFNASFSWSSLILHCVQVYHARFFKACRSKKAVKEAFCFTKLIKNPTLSTFNMLLSVCATAQDSEGNLLFCLGFIWINFFCN